MKYSLLEIMFSKWRWVRKKSKSYWLYYPGGEWVKLSHKDVVQMQELNISFKHPFVVEDWR